MYYILYTNKANIPVWELLSGEDAMNCCVNELVSKGIDPDDITVIHNDDGKLSFIE